MTTISAQTILRSRNAAAPHKVLSTLLLRYPRFIHAEFMTHRLFSRNAASSRAIPVKKIIDDILADTAMPLHWGANQKGMQAYEECDEPMQIVQIWDDGYGALELPTRMDRERVWLEARDRAIYIAEKFDEAGYHKQVVNRLLEPFSHITVLVSATEWDNFIELRDHHAAEPHIQILAREIKKCLDDQSTVQTLMPGQWHMPFVETGDYHQDFRQSKSVFELLTIAEAKKLSVARCASTSYKTVDGFDMTFEKAEEVYDKLFSKPFHASPFEHVAQADECSTKCCGPNPWYYPQEHGNYVGFRQLRKQLEHTL